MEEAGLQHKMSKKIAQLTKVIYQLNTRNDDLVSDLAQLGEHHENEIHYVCANLESFYFYGRKNK